MNGGVIGAVNLPTTNSATGVWNIEEVKLAQQQGIWPPLLTPDPYWEYVSLLLSGVTATINGAQNNTFLDSSTNNFSITRNGNVTQGSFSPYGSNWGVYFDGTGDYLSVAQNSALLFGSGDFTVEVWCFVTNINSNRPIVGFWSDSSGANQSWLLSAYSSGAYTFIIQGTGAEDLEILSSANSIQLNSWTHVAVTRSSSTWRMFINGTQTATGNYSGTLATPGNSLTIGTAESAPVLSGYLSNLRIVKGTAVYTSSFTPSTTPLVAVNGTSLLTCQSNRFIDNSVNNFAITRNGDTSITKFSPFNLTYQTSFSYSAYFNGGSNRLTTGTSSQFNLAGANITLECWVYMTAYSGVYNRLITIGPNDVESSLDFSITSSGVFSVGIPKGGQANVNSGATTISLNTWTHLAFSLDGTVGSIYINGNRVGQSSGWNFTSTSSNYFYVGYDATPTVDGKFTGNVSNVRLVVGTALYTGSSVTVPTSSLTAITNTKYLALQSATFVENSINNFILGITGSLSTSLFSPFTDTYVSLPYSTSVLGGSGYFDGTGDYLSINSGMNVGTNDFTIEVWVYPTAWASEFSSIFSTRATSTTFGATDVWALGINSTGYPYIYSGNFQIQGSAGQILLKTWTNITVTRSGSTMRLFVNGNLVQTSTSSQNYTQSAASIGANRNGSEAFAGYISGLRLITGTALYINNFTTSSTPLTAVANTNLLLNVTNAGILDSSTINDLETVGNAQVTTTVKKYGTGSMSFDGIGDRLVGPTNSVNEMGSGNWTCEFWVNALSFSNVQIFTSYEAASGTTYGIFSWVVYCNNGKFAIDTSTGSSSLFSILSNSDIPTNTWTHLAVTRSGNTCRLFINGTIDASSTSFIGTPYVPNNSSLFVGGAVRGFPFTGYISDLRITRGVARYTENFTPPVFSLPRF